MKKKNNPELLDPFRINIGTVIFFVLVFYLSVRILISLGHVKLSVYEVQNSYIDTNIHATALIVREETLVNAVRSGYVSYYVRDGEKIGKNKTVYTVDETGSIYTKLKDNDDISLSMSKEGLTEVRTRISNFENYFDYSNFSELYNFRYDIENTVLELTNEALIDQLTSLDSESDALSTYQKVSSSESGIITYYQDGYEAFDIHNFNASDVDKSTYKKQTLKTGEIINAGDPVYKLVTSENWYLVAPITPEEAAILQDQTEVRINIHNSSRDIRCPFELVKQDNTDFIILSLNQQMVNYINDRYIDVVIFMEQNSGLKIPNTSITKKTVYQIPKTWFSKGSDTTKETMLNRKVLDEKGEPSIEQIDPEILKRDDTYYYVNPDSLTPSDVLLNIDTNETMMVSSFPTLELDGVYCVNKGITVFRNIEIKFQDDEYTIVSADVPYSIAWYDRIILNQEMVEENQIIK